MPENVRKKTKGMQWIREGESKTNGRKKQRKNIRQ
jgi:hypothetical protein